jgi:hypothetical protein
MRQGLIIIAALLAALPAWADYPDGINLGHDVTLQVVTGDLTSDGTQYADSVSTAGVGVDSTLISDEFDLAFGSTGTWNSRTVKTRTLLDAYFDITIEVRAVSSGTADMTWRVQARNDDGTWTDLVDSLVVENPGTSWTESTLKGYAELSNTFNQVPFDYRILLRCNEASEGYGRVKSGSTVRAIFKALE